MNALDPAPVAAATITELAPTVRISLRLADREAARGLPLPARIGTRAVDGARTVLCLGPDEWLVEAPEADGPALASALADLASRTAVSAVDVSDREITFALEGPGVLDLLAAGCPLDLARMPLGNGTRTVFDAAQAVLTREADDRFRLTVWRSFAPHVRAILDLAARELALGF